jgi:hypothetical protein
MQIYYSRELTSYNTVDMILKLYAKKLYLKQKIRKRCLVFFNEYF